MPNPFFQNQNNRNVNPANNMANYKNIYRMLSSSRNPNELMMKMAQQNPNLQSTLNLIQSSKNPQLLFNQLCQQRGIDPQEFIRQVTS